MYRTDIMRTPRGYLECIGECSVHQADNEMGARGYL